MQTRIFKTCLLTLYVSEMNDKVIDFVVSDLFNVFNRYLFEYNYKDEDQS